MSSVLSSLSVALLLWIAGGVFKFVGWDRAYGWLTWGSMFLVIWGVMMLAALVDPLLVR